MLDEPTNDLDIATLTILEDYLSSFYGAVIAISHDRYFLDKMASEIWELNGTGQIRRYNGNYQDYAAKAFQEDSAEKPQNKQKRKNVSLLARKN